MNATTVSATAKNLVSKAYGDAVMKDVMCTANGKVMDTITAAACKHAVSIFSGARIEHDPMIIAGAEHLLTIMYGALMVEDIKSMAAGMQVGWYGAGCLKHLELVWSGYYNQ